MDTVLNIIVPPLAKPYSYLVKKEDEEKLKIGDRVQVVFNRRKATGFIINKEKNCEKKYKDIKLNYILPLDLNHKCFSNEQLKFFEWIGNYYSEKLARVIETAIPTFIRPKKEEILFLSKNFEKLKGSLQTKILNFVKEHPTGISKTIILNNFPKSNACLNNLIKKEYLKKSTEVLEFKLKTTLAPEWAKKEIDLNPNQKNAYQKIKQKINENKFSCFLLYGVTGSGKTEVYFEAINDALKENKGVILIVPEIALTPQLADRFAARLNQPFALLHSGLSDRERWTYWQKLLTGEIKIAIGARSAIFAPVENLGLVVVDEEHDSSYKQSDRLRYNARDLAIVRAKLNNAPVVLGSATPTIESIYNAHLKKYTLLQLDQKFSTSQINKYFVVDLSKLKVKEMISKNISPLLFEKMQETLNNNDQIFILYNRRGYANYLQCSQCSEVLQCKHCSVSLTYHKEDRNLVCHYCGFNQEIPKECPTCKKSVVEEQKEIFIQLGSGTEKVFDELVSLFPDKKIARLDRDVAQDINEYRKVLDAMRNKEIDILVGTQMIAKGHDLPNVTLVGVINCDIGLNFPDFRATEKSFQLLTQVAGRAGRGEKKGLVILQTRDPKNPSLQYTINSDYFSYVNYELKLRKIAKYPPFTKLLRIIASCDSEKFGFEFMHKAQEKVKQLIEKKSYRVTILGPTVAPIAKIKNNYRCHLLFKSENLMALQEISLYFHKLNDKYKNIRIAVDLDPQDLM